MELLAQGLQVLANPVEFDILDGGVAILVPLDALGEVDESTSLGEDLLGLEVSLLGDELHIGSEAIRIGVVGVGGVVGGGIVPLAPRVEGAFDLDQRGVTAEVECVGCVLVGAGVGIVGAHGIWFGCGWCLGLVGCWFGFGMCCHH